MLSLHRSLSTSCDFVCVYVYFTSFNTTQLCFWHFTHVNVRLFKFLLLSILKVKIDLKFFFCHFLIRSILNFIYFPEIFDNFKLPMNWNDWRESKTTFNIRLALAVEPIISAQLSPPSVEKHNQLQSAFYIFTVK